MRHALAILVIALIVGATGVCTSSWAQTAVRPRARPAPAPEATVSAPVSPPVSPAPAAATARLTLQGLPRRFDAAPACRARCTATRVACEAVEGDCAPAWSTCLKRCEGA